MLQILHLGTNDINNLPLGIFRNLTNLTFLSLSGNRLLTLHVKLFTELNMLQIFNLDNNDINNLQLEIFRNLTSLTFLALSGKKPVYILNCSQN